MNVSKYQPCALRTANLQTLSLDECAFDRLHSSIGLMTEAIELAEAFSSGDVVNMKEEVGDMLWYIPLMCRGLKINLSDIFSSEQWETNPIVVSSPDSIIQICGKILNAQKKAIAYENYIPTGAYIDMLRTLTRMIGSLAERYGFTLEQCADANIAKLRTRYPSGFSNMSALVRNLSAERAVLNSELPPSALIE